MNQTVIHRTRGETIYFFYKVSNGGKPEELSAKRTAPKSSHVREIKRIQAELQQHLNNLVDQLESGQMDYPVFVSILKQQYRREIPKPSLPEEKKRYLVLVSDFLKHYNSSYYEQSSIDQVEYGIRRFNDFLIERAKSNGIIKGDVVSPSVKVDVLSFDITTFDRSLIREFIYWMSEQKSVSGKPYSHRSIEICLVKLKTFWNWGLDTVSERTHGFNFPTHNPFYRPEYPLTVIDRESRRKKHQRTDYSLISDEEFDQLYDEMIVRVPRHAQALRLGKITGASPADIIKMKKTDVDLKNLRVVYGRKKLKRSNQWAEMPIFPEHVEFFRMLQLQFPESVYLIPSTNGSMLDKRGLYRAFDYSQNKILKVKKFTVNTLRHTLITNLLQSGYTMLEVANMVGNSEQMIRTHYNHIKAENVTQIRKVK